MPDAGAYHGSATRGSLFASVTGLLYQVSTFASKPGPAGDYYTYMYQWLRNGAEVPEATDTSYTLVDADEGKTIKVKVSFLDDANNQESRTSAATVAVAPRPNSPPTGGPPSTGRPRCAGR